MDRATLGGKPGSLAGGIVQRWGEIHYRKFRLYLWATAHAIATNLMSAYRLGLERPSALKPGPLAPMKKF